MDYLGAAIGICLVVGFYKIGELDDGLRPVHGLVVGAAVLLCQLLFPGGYLRLVLYAAAGLAVLTVYKIVMDR